MSSLAELSQRLARLREISGIMTAMKSLSLVETRKLGRFIGHQRDMLTNIETAAADFLRHFPVEAGAKSQAVILLLVGSERGFCGNFNERVVAALDRLAHWEQAPALLVIGRRLGAKLESRPGGITLLEGATVTEEVPAALDRLIDAVNAARRRFADGGVALYSLAHQAESEPTLKRLVPITPAQHMRYASAPDLQLAPLEFFAELLDQHLLAALYGLLYESLAAEQRQRLAHMEHAIDRLDQTLAQLALKRNALRQEKIVEEIEVILSSEQAFVKAVAA